MIRPLVQPERTAVAHHYDELDAFYRELWGEDLHHGLWLRGNETPAEATANLTRVVAARARIGPGDRVCDVGCGYGGSSRWFAEHLGARVVGITVSEAQRRHLAGRRGGPGAPRYVLGDWADNPFTSAGFDAVVAIESLSHMSDPRSFFAECRRVLRPGGRLVIAAWLAAENPSPWRIRYLLRPICTEGRLHGLGSRTEHRRFLQEAGLRADGFEDLSKRVRRTWTVCARRAVVRLLHDPDARRYLRDPERTERGFARALVRIGVAYRLGALRYGLFTATRRPTDDAAKPTRGDGKAAASAR